MFMTVVIEANRGVALGSYSRLGLHRRLLTLLGPHKTLRKATQKAVRQSRGLKTAGQSARASAQTCVDHSASNQTDWIKWAATFTWNGGETNNGPCEEGFNTEIIGLTPLESRLPF
jgi:hypothetical protein